MSASNSAGPVRPRGGDATNAGAAPRNAVRGNGGAGIRIQAAGSLHPLPGIRVEQVTGHGIRQL